VDAGAPELIGHEQQDQDAGRGEYGANGGKGGIQFAKEVGGTLSSRPQPTVGMPGPEAVDLYLTVNPAAKTVQPSYAVTKGGKASPRTNLGGPEPIPAG
jgi:hypothetical protein